MKAEEKEVTEDEMVRWHHHLNGHEFEQAPEMVKDREAWLLRYAKETWYPSSLQRAHL